MPSTTYSSIAQNDNTDPPLDGMLSGGSGMSSSSSRRGRRRSTKLQYVGEASYTSSVVNLLNTIVGAGILAMPKAMSKFGMTLGVLVVVFSGCTAGFGLYLQARCAKYVERGSASFFALSQLTYPNAAVIFDAAIAIKCFGVAVSYLIIIGQLMPKVVLGFNHNIAEASILLDRHFWITCFMLVVIPLSFLRRLDSLKYTSFIALVSIAYLIIIVLSHFIAKDTLSEAGPVRYVSWAGPVEALSSFPVIVFAYTCHQNMFSIINEISDNSHASTVSVVFGSIGSACAMYILVGITGYISFGDNIIGNIIAQYAPSWTTTIGCAAIVILVVFSYPLQVHPCRASIDNVLKWRPRRLHTPLPGSRVPEMSDTRFAFISTFVIVGTYITAMSVNSLDTVLAYVGSTGSTSISFILPGIFYWKIANPESDNRHLLKDFDDEHDEEFGYGAAETTKAKWLRKGALALAGYGVLVMVTCLTLNIFGPGEELHEAPML